MQFKVLLKARDDGGYTASVLSLPDCTGEGDTFEEALENIKKAIKLYLEPMDMDC